LAEVRPPRLHVVTDDGVLARPDFPLRAREVLERGGAAVALHLRGPRTDGAPTFALAKALAPHARASGSLLLVNDRVDVALAAGAHGVHLGRRSLLPADARRLLPAGAVVGCSAATRAEAEAAGAGGADFLLVGHVYPTPSHPGEPAVGPGRIREVAGAGVRVAAIGGITPARVAEVRAAGARGVAAIRAVWDAEDPAEAVARFLEAWKDEFD